MTSLRSLILSLSSLVSSCSDSFTRTRADSSRSLTNLIKPKLKINRLSSTDGSRAYRGVIFGGAIAPTLGAPGVTTTLSAPVYLKLAKFFFAHPSEFL